RGVAARAAVTMNDPKVAQRRQTGVYYSPEDLAGFTRRMVVLAVDLMVVLLVCLPVFVLASAAGLPSVAANACAFLLAWSYMVGLKATGFATVGYRLANVQLVDLQGGRVSLWRSTCRFLFLWATLGNVIDLLWLSHDPNRQTLRDKIVGTYVIRRGSRPVGSGPVTYPTYFVAGLS